VSAVPPIGPTAPIPLSPISGQLPAAAPAPPAGGGFASLLAERLKSMEAKVDRADQLVKAFALDDSVPVHQVTYALEEARLSVELAMQVRAKLLDGYRELMNMQL
jgi:flagellar hook-basal body complex protein FliE